MAFIYSSFPPLLIVTLLLLSSLSDVHFALSPGRINDRKALEIVIGGGSDTPPSPDPEDCPPPPPPPSPCPPPPPPPMPSCPPPSLPPTQPSPPPPSPSPSIPPPPPPPSPPPPSPSPSIPPPPPPPPPSPPPPRSPTPLFTSPYIARVHPTLKRFQKLVTGDPKGILKSWEGTDVCSKEKYIGLECATFPGTNHQALASVQFNQFQFSGPNLRLDNFLEQLKEVSIFHANSNNFLYSVPRLDKLPYLFELDLSNNKLSGEFPNEVLKATNLTFLDLRFNSFVGSVPPMVFNLDLDVLFINNNKLVQPLPKNLGAITALYLSFANNRFTGGIPRSISDVRNLKEVLFLNNRLTGCLPYQIGKLKQLKLFDAGFNELTGPIPYSFGCLDNMEQLNLARNKFYGTIPEIICDLPKLANFSLSYNYFTQVGPKCRELIKKKVLDVRVNCILGLPNQRSPHDCAKFFMRKQSCPDSKMLFKVPCRKDPYRQQGTLDTAPSPPLIYHALDGNRVRHL